MPTLFVTIIAPSAHLWNATRTVAQKRRRHLRSAVETQTKPSSTLAKHQLLFVKLMMAKYRWKIRNYLTVNRIDKVSFLMSSRFASSMNWGRTIFRCFVEGVSINTAVNVIRLPNVIIALSWNRDYPKQISREHPYHSLRLTFTKADYFSESEWCNYLSPTYISKNRNIWSIASFTDISISTTGNRHISAILHDVTSIVKNA